MAIAKSLAIGYSTHFSDSDGPIFVIGTSLSLSLLLSGNRHGGGDAAIAIAVWKRAISLDTS